MFCLTKYPHISYLIWSSQQRGRNCYPHFMMRKLRLGKVWELVHGGKTGKRKNLLKICSKLGFLTLSSVLLLLKVSSLEAFLQRLHCALYVCVSGTGAGMCACMCTRPHTLRCTHMNACTHTCIVHTCTGHRSHRCILTHGPTCVRTGMHVHTQCRCTHTCTHACTAEATGAFSVGEGFCYSVYFPSLQ